MKRKIVRTITLAVLVLSLVLSAAGPEQAKHAKTPYPSMAPMDQYLMATRHAEITLARSAAPVSISRDAGVLVLGGHGYETAVKGKNVSCAWCNDHGPPESTIPTFGIPSYGLRSASIRRPYDPIFRSLSKRLSWY